VSGLYSWSNLFRTILEVHMAIQPQPAPMGPVPPPPPDLCTECIGPGGNRYITTVEGCIADGGTPSGDPFPCAESEARRQQLEEREHSA
jgi:hypothetical protein